MMQWLLQLLPQQRAKGDWNLQAGRIEGDLHNSQNSNNQTVYNIVVMSAHATAPETTGPPTAPLDPTPKASQLAAKPKIDATQSQRGLLRLMAQSPVNESLAEAFMRREFDTDRVKRLTTFECIRTTRYLEACIQREAIKREKEGSFQ